MRALRLSELPPAVRAKLRFPKGQAANALPELWLEQFEGGIRLMERHHDNDVCLGIVSGETLARLRKETGELV